MNINVTAFRGIYDAFDLSDGRVGAPLDPVPQFMSMQLDRARLQQIRRSPGRQGDGAVPASVVALGLPVDVGLRRPSGAAARHLGRPRLGARHRRLLLRDERRRHGHHGGETAAIKAGDAIPLRVGETKAFENTATAPLEFLVVGIARDMTKKNDLLASPPQRLGGPGRGGPGRGRG